MLRSTQGLVALVTGGASGLGKGTVERLVSNGAKVAIFDLPSSKGAEVAAALGKGKAIFYPGNVTSEDDVKKTMAGIKQEFGRLDALVNCAGIAFAFKLYSIVKMAPMPECLSRTQQTLNVNVMGTLNMIRYSLEMMGENAKDEQGQRGVVINTASIAAFDGQAGQVAYAASKGAIASMTLPLARDYADDGIRFLCIAPGLFDTPLLSSLPEKALKFLTQLVPNPSRFGKPEEFGALVQHLIENQYMNGEIVRIDGSLRMPP